LPLASSSSFFNRKHIKDTVWWIKRIEMDIYASKTGKKNDQLKMKHKTKV
jgi:hypothetical protein